MNDITEKEYTISEILFVGKSKLESCIVKETLYVQNGRYSDCFIYVTDGNCKYTFKDGNRINVTKGDVMYLAKGSKYIMEINENGYSPIFIDFNFVGNGHGALTSTKFLLRNTDKLLSAFRKIYEMWFREPIAYKTLCMGYLYEIYGQIINGVKESYIPQNKVLVFEQIQKRILKGYTSSEFNISELVDSLGISRGHFRRLFKKIYRCTPGEYIRNLRITHAKNLLICTDMTIKQVAEETGFEDAAYFSKVFKESENCCPKSYRTNAKYFL